MFKIESTESEKLVDDINISKKNINIKTNPFAMQTTYTKEDIAHFHKKAKKEKHSERYRKELPNKNYKFPYEDYITLKVKGYSKSSINIKTYCNYKLKKTSYRALRMSKIRRIINKPIYINPLTYIISNHCSK